MRAKSLADLAYAARDRGGFGESIARHCEHLARDEFAEYDARIIELFAAEKYETFDLCVTAMCMWESVIDDPKLFDALRAYHGGVIAARDYVAQLAELCERSFWYARHVLGFDEDFDYLYCPAFMGLIPLSAKYAMPDFATIARRVMARIETE